MSDRPATDVAVVVITRDRARELLHTLARLHELPERPAIVVVDHGSRDDTPAQVRARFPGVVVLEPGRDLGAAGRTLGARAVEAPYVAFCDDDSWWAPGALARGAALLDANPTVALVAGRVLLGTDQRLEPACIAMAESPLPDGHGLPGRRVLGFVACGAIVRRTAFLSVGGFHPRLGIGVEEQLLATDLAAAGWQLVYRDDLVVHHHPSRTRDHGDRRAVLIRNQLWCAWLRRRGPAAAGVTLRAARQALADTAARAGLAGAVRGAGWVARDRRPVPRWLEAELQLADAAVARRARAAA